jgi:hypothetical protein
VYTDRTFALALEDTLILRDEQVIAFDTVLARGGLTDVRAALSYRGGRVALGVGLHLLTGNNRVDYRRIFSDSAYVPLRLRNELTYSGAGVSLGVLVEAVPRVHLAGLLRYDADLSIEKDSVASGDVPLPVTLGTGLRWEPSAALVVQGHLLSRRWGRADRALRDLGGSGARNTLELAGGVEWLRNPRNPDRFPLRLGLRRSPLPFPIGDGAQQPTEVVAALGTGLGFAGGRATLDLSLERAWRRETAAFRERGVALRIGIGVRP